MFSGGENFVELIKKINDVLINVELNPDNNLSSPANQNALSYFTIKPQWAAVTVPCTHHL